MIPTGSLWTISISFFGAPGESKNLYATVPFDCTLLHVSMCNLTDGTGTLQISDDGTAITDADALGTGSTPTVMNIDDMSGDQYPHIAAGSVLTFALTDTDTDDILIVCTFAVG